MFDGCFRGKTVLVTGHTGFKGSWLTSWLLRLGAKVVGIALDVPTVPAMFDVNGLESRLAHHIADIRNPRAVHSIFETALPDFVFHLAAQAIVSRSFFDPLNTVTTNAIGTANVLESLRRMNRPCTAVLITSDKVYDNVSWDWGYRERDILGGKDVYSGSKAAAEAIIKSYFHSFLAAENSRVALGVARAGNVIGGGDWAQDRIVADCMRAWSGGDVVTIRSPNATRPWQHVLEPLGGYLALACALATKRDLRGEVFNFGPRAEQNKTVLQLLSDLWQVFAADSRDALYRITEQAAFEEAKLLKLNCDKALVRLNWMPVLNYEETVRFTASWYRHYYRGGRGEMSAFTSGQIAEYEELAARRCHAWANADK